ncbi:MAG: cytidine deaminase [Clostridiales bacterium]|nr:cytidine deaminase [Clostridiales bacterium]
MPDTKYAQLLEAAREARENAYAPYSHFQVGAALLSRDGRIFTGVNLENASYPAGLCAERAALAAAVTAGIREFSALAVCAGGQVTPCGLCRQALSEFGDMDVICAVPSGEPRLFRLSELLPAAFRLD